MCPACSPTRPLPATAAVPRRRRAPLAWPRAEPRGRSWLPRSQPACSPPRPSRGGCGFGPPEGGRPPDVSQWGTRASRPWESCWLWRKHAKPHPSGPCRFSLWQQPPCRHSCRGPPHRRGLRRREDPQTVVVRVTSRSRSGGLRGHELLTFLSFKFVCITTTQGRNGIIVSCCWLVVRLVVGLRVQRTTMWRSWTWRIIWWCR